MPRYLVERRFADGLTIPINAVSAKTCQSVIDSNAEAGVTWVQSLVRVDHRTSYCVYDGPTPDAIRQSARRNGLPVEQLTEVRVLDPYFYTPELAS